MSKRYYQDRDDMGQRFKKRKFAEPVNIENKLEARLESLITKIGEKSLSSLENNLKGLANVLEADLPNYKDRILKIICTCACNYPDKITIYSTLVGLLNVKNYKCGEEFLDLMAEEVKDALKSGYFERSQLMIRFLSDLVNTRVVVPASLVNLFENFLAVTMEDDVSQVRSDWFVHTVLLALPWVGKELWNSRSADCERIFSTIESYISKRQKSHVRGLKVWSSDEPHQQEEYLDCLWTQIQRLKEDKWVEQHIKRPYLAFSDVFQEALQHPLPNIVVPPHTESTIYPLPQVVFRMFDYTDVPEGPTLPGAHSIERFLIEECLNRIIQNHHKDRKDCAQQLLSFSEKEKIPLDYCIIEVVFGQLFKLPVSPYLEHFYGSLFVELCKNTEATIPGVLAQATALLYERIDTMNVTCVTRFISWLAYHLSQYQYKWSWDDWSHVTQLSPDSTQRKFVVELLEQCQRYSYHDYLVEVVPESLHSLLPAPASFTYKFTPGNEETVGFENAKELVDAIKAKKDTKELLQMVNTISDKPSQNISMDENTANAKPPLRIEVVLQVLLRAGAKSISHTFRALERFDELIKMAVTQEDDEVHVLTVLHSFWKHHPQMIQLILDKLIRKKLIQSTSFVNWIFSKHMFPDFLRCCMWEMMHSTLRKITKQTKKTKTEYDTEKLKLERLEEKESKEGEMKGQSQEINKKREDVERLSDQLETIQAEQKQVFLVVFQRFVIMLTQYISDCEQQQKDLNTQTFGAILDRLREIFFTYHNEVFPYLSRLETLLFTPELDHRILEVFNQFKALRT